MARAQQCWPLPPPPPAHTRTACSQRVAAVLHRPPRSLLTPQSVGLRGQDLIRDLTAGTRPGIPTPQAYFQIEGCLLAKQVKPQVAVDVDDEPLVLSVQLTARAAHEQLPTMRGLPFPNAARYDRADEDDHSSPTTQGDDIPIDPALAALPLDPALLAADAHMRDTLVSTASRPCSSPHPSAAGARTRRDARNSGVRPLCLMSRVLGFSRTGKS